MGMIQFNVVPHPRRVFVVAARVESKALKFVVAAVAENWSSRVLAATEVDGFRFGGLEFYGC